MKVILTGLGMKGDIMHYPEDAAPVIRIVHHDPLRVLYRYENTPDAPILTTICEFEWTGKIENQARVYQLSNITKG